MTRIGIMGGTFDPIHTAHLLAAEEAHAAYSLSQVIFIPAAQPPHKAVDGPVPAEHRYAMTLAATLDVPYFDISRIELERPGPSYTVDTLRELHRIHPEDTEFFFITGYDAVFDIVTWKDPEEICALCRLVAVSRPGYNPQRIEELPTAIRKNILRLEIPLMTISSTEIRRRLRAGKRVRFLVPPAVEHYIQKHSLYKGDQ